MNKSTSHSSYSCHSHDGDGLKSNSNHNHCHLSNTIDLFLWSTFTTIVLSYAFYLLAVYIGLVTTKSLIFEHFFHFSHAIFILVNTMWWGIALGIIFIMLLTKIPRDLVLSAFGSGRGYRGVIRATVVGVLLDLCNHGILMVGAKLYRQGISLGQLFAFLIASPWNSFSLTFVLFALIGWQWTLLFIVLSMIIAITSGLIIDWLTNANWLPENPNYQSLSDSYHFREEATKHWQQLTINRSFIFSMVIDGIKESKMILRWIFLGIVFTALLQSVIPKDLLSQYFGPSLMGLGLTLIAATLIEVCSEGSSPIAADLMSRANAPGNGFTFLMAGVSTDYTEIAVIKETTGRWKLALLLPIATVPQILILGWILNLFSFS